MPGFHSRMGDRLRSPEEGADTVVWLCVSESAKKQPSGRFFEGTQLPSLHLLFPFSLSLPLPLSILPLPLQTGPLPQNTFLWPGRDPHSKTKNCS